MTTEDSLQELLDTDPRDHQTRLVLADLLGDLGDERAQGYLMMGWARLYPRMPIRYTDPLMPKSRWSWMSTTTGRSYNSTVKSYWFDNLTKTYTPAPEGWHLSWGGWHPYYESRRGAEDDLARAWLKVDRSKRDRDLADAVDRYSVRA